MRSLGLALACFTAVLHADVVAGRYDMAAVRDASTLEPRALTAAVAEKDVFQPVKVIATGGSKRGVATAAAGIADDRFTAIMPVVAPILDSPGGPYVEGMKPAEITRANEQFLADLGAGKI